MKIGFTDLSLPRSGALVVGATAKAKLLPTAKSVDEKTGGAISRAIAAARFTGKKNELIEVLGAKGVAADRVLLAGFDEPAKLKPNDVEAIGAGIARQLAKSREKRVTVALDAIVAGAKGAAIDDREVAARLAFGAQLASYRFDKYHSKLKPEERPTLTDFTVATKAHQTARRLYRDMDKLADGIFFTRDLVSEPANVLHPPAFARRCRELGKLGVKVEVLGVRRMERLGMGALLGVGQGSAHESQLVIMRWNGAGQRAKPIAFIGKGVTFDTGGISLKPAAGMEDMKWDMGGAGAVVGAMRALAGRKAKVNAIGVVGLVENMPSATAQRPGDVVTSMSGQTVEVINTDAEGRLVLADVLWYTQDRFKPQAMIDLATLTGAMIISLGSEYAGLFANDDALAERLIAAGEAEGERVWRFPLGEAYDKMLESPIADMRNIGISRDAGSITAAQFLQRFVNKVPWAHLDIAGMAWSKRDRPTVPKGGTGYGVRLLDRLVREHYEK